MLPNNVVEKPVDGSLVEGLDMLALLTSRCFLNFDRFLSLFRAHK